MTNRRRAFTLIEVTVAVFLTALLAAVVMFSLRSPVQVAQMREAVGLIRRQDELTRQYARTFDRPVQLLVDVDRNRVACLDENGPDRRGPVLQLPADYRIGQVMLVDARSRSGQISIPCSARGYLPSYALALCGPNEQKQWIVVVGTTGKLLEMANEQEVQKTFAVLHDQGHDPG